MTSYREWEAKAIQRVRNSKKLQPYTDTIFYDWTNWDEHMEWIATAPVIEIVDWAQTTEQFARDRKE